MCVSVLVLTLNDAQRITADLGRASKREPEEAGRTPVEPQSPASVVFSTVLVLKDTFAGIQSNTVDIFLNFTANAFTGACL